MSYHSYAFLLLFLPVVFLLYYLLPLRRRWYALLFSSLFYFCAASGWLVVYLLVSAVSIWLLGLALDRLNGRIAGLSAEGDKSGLAARFLVRKKLLVLLAVCVNIGMLAFLKYTPFAVNIVNHVRQLFGISDLALISFTLPLGISYYSLMAVSYVMDVYREKYEAEKNPCRLLLFLCWFPHVVEGPLGRYGELSATLFAGNRFCYRGICFGLQLMIWGLFKKLVIADRANAFVSEVFSNYADYGGIFVILAVLFYTLQIYAEFSGCMDIVSGVSQLFGVSLASNFRQPFCSKSIGEFWRRWHITLGLWLKEYIFYPISFSQWYRSMVKRARGRFGNYWGKLLTTAFALFFVWFANGLWHGASFKFVAYGLYYYALMMLGDVMAKPNAALKEKLGIGKDNKGFAAFQVARTFLLVNLGMLLFRADNISVALSMLSSVIRGFSPDSMGSLLPGLGLDIQDMLLLIAGVAVLTLVGFLKERGHSLRAELAEKRLPLRWGILMASLLAVIIFGAYGEGYGAVDFIYAQF